MKLPTPRCAYVSLFLKAALLSGGLSLTGSGPAHATEAGAGAEQTAAGEKPAVEQRPAEKEKSSEETSGRVRPLVVTRPGELDERSMSGAYRFYMGTTHAHSGYSGDHAKTIATKFNNGAADYDRHTPFEVFEKAKANGFDFYFMTDHSSPEQNEFYKGGFTDEHWAATREQAERASTANFIALRGYEFSRNVDREGGGLGHMNVLNTAGWNSAYAQGHTFEWLYDWLAAQGGNLVVAQFNHPQMPGIGKAKNFNDYKGRTRARNEAVRLAEIWNSGEAMAYVPVVRKIWALGWKVAPASGTDVHGPVGVENRRMRTGVLAERLTPEAIMEALKARRVYASLEPRLHVEFTLDGFMMGSALASRAAGDMKAKVFVNDPAGSVLTKVEVYGANYEANGGASQVVASLPVREG